MDSLIASYASSDEEQDTPSFFSSLPPATNSKPPSLLFGSLPPPKPHNPAKRLVEFKPPITITHHDQEDDDDAPRPKKRASSDAHNSASGGLCALLPPPKNAPLGSGAGESGHAGRRSVLEIPSSSAPSTLQPTTVEPPQYDHDAYRAPDPPSQSHVNWEVGVSAPISAFKEEDEGGGRGKAERRGGRNKIPCDIIEVKQDELMSNRPREDQVKLTGLAFGPSYKPVSSAKDKPSKLHKRKHQIGSLYYELKQKEMELAERRARGQLTKAETQAKYGW